MQTFIKEVFTVQEAKPTDDSDVLVFIMDDNELGHPMPALYFNTKGFVPSEVVCDEFNWIDDSKFTHWCYSSF